ncbi:MAG: helix-hairpin-helix domain-containing protein [Flavobacteriaceae bacterium]
MQSITQKPVYSKLFNPNFISDYKGYVLGMSPAEIDRLHSYRESGRFINTIEDFQTVTQISDTLLDSISPYFRFPKWTARAITKALVKKQSGVIVSLEKPEVKSDLNKARAEDLMRINGVGEVLSRRIIKFRDALGGFLTDEQLNDVYGLKGEVAERILNEFTVVSSPEINTISLRDASVEDLAQLVYISYDLARRIVRYRDSIGQIKTLDELTKLQDFPADRINRIKLYLTL